VFCSSFKNLDVPFEVWIKWLPITITRDEILKRSKRIMSVEPMKTFPPAKNDKANNTEQCTCKLRGHNKQTRVTNPTCRSHGNSEPTNAIPPQPMKLVIRDMGIKKPRDVEIVEAYNELLDYVVWLGREWESFIDQVGKLLDGEPLPEKYVKPVTDSTDQ
jgi:hypothetical protein